MKTSQEIIGTKILIAGYGREGQALTQYLSQTRPDLEITIADQNPKLKLKDYPTIAGRGYLQHVDQFETIIRSPGIPPDTPELQAAKHITTATNIFFEQADAKIIGVTGTKGKSTTSALIHHLLEHQNYPTVLVGNIGKTAISVLPQLTPETIVVMELSSYQLADFHYRPDIAVLLAITPEHLNYHSNFNNYLQAKANLVKAQTETDYLIYNQANQQSQALAQTSNAIKLPFPNHGVDRSCWIESGQVFTQVNQENQVIIPVSKLPLLGEANQTNVLAALTCALALQLNVEQLGPSLAKFQPLAHRLEFVGKYKQISFYNDSLATTPEACQAALKALAGSVSTLILGGYDRGLDYSDLVDSILAANIEQLVLFPDTGQTIQALIQAKPSQTQPKLVAVESMQEAVEAAYRFKSEKKEPVCLLSPAAASFNLFTDYQDRGEQFKHWVKKLS